MKKQLSDKTQLNLRIKKDYRFAGLIVFAAALLAEMLIFVNAQAGKLADEVSKDFTLLLTADSKMSESALDNVKINIENLPGVERVVFISKKDMLERIKQEDPQLVDSVLSSGKNPLPDTWEAKVSVDSMLNLESLAASMLVFDGVTDVQYKKQEAWAVRHLLFYKQLTSVALLFASFSCFMFVFIVLAHENSVSDAFQALLTSDFSFFSAGFFAGIAALVLTTIFLYPVKTESMFWSWTSPLAQILFLLCCSMFSWGLRRWKLRR